MLRHSSGIQLFIHLKRKNKLNKTAVLFLGQLSMNQFSRIVTRDLVEMKIDV